MIRIHEPKRKECKIIIGKHQFDECLELKPCYKALKLDGKYWCEKPKKETRHYEIRC